MSNNNIMKVILLALSATFLVACNHVSTAPEVCQSCAVYDPGTPNEQTVCAPEGAQPCQ